MFKISDVETAEEYFAEGTRLRQWNGVKSVSSTPADARIPCLMHGEFTHYSFKQYKVIFRLYSGATIQAL
jgi:hypothetical protein